MVLDVLSNGPSDCSVKGCTPKPASNFAIWADSFAGRREPGFPALLAQRSSLFASLRLLTPDKCPQVLLCPLPTLGLPGQRPHWFSLSLCTRSPTPVRFPPPPPSPAPVSGVIRGSCLNWEKGPHPAFTLPVGDGGLAGRSWGLHFQPLCAWLIGPWSRRPCIPGSAPVLSHSFTLSWPRTLTHNYQGNF